MKKQSCVSTVALNIFQLKQLPIFKIQTHRWLKFKQKQKFLPFFRSLTYQNKHLMSKMFVFKVSQQKKEGIIRRRCQVITQKQIISLQDLYQILDEHMDRIDFNKEVQKIKLFEKMATKYINNKFSQNYIKYNKTPFLSFNIYKDSQDYVIKAHITNFNYQLEIYQKTQKIDRPNRYVIQNEPVKEVLNSKLKQLLQLVKSIEINNEINSIYTNFYDKVSFQVDQYHLQLQVYQNFPLLRLKNYVPIRFNDRITNEPLTGPIFANADPQCMYGHFFGYNANTTKQLEGSYCQSCMMPIEQLQQFQLLMILRDNILNPQRKDIIYCPQYNRFKLYSKVSIQAQKNEQNQVQEQEKKQQKTIIDYLNYYHLKTNLKQMTNKKRQKFMTKNKLQQFSLVCKLYNKQFLIMDPARGRNCQHLAFADLRSYYLSYNPQKNLYTCPIAQCNEQLAESDLMYLKQAEILIEYAKFKMQQCRQLVNTAKVIIDHNRKKVQVTYRFRDGEKSIEVKKDEINDYYKTIQDPYIPFMQYGLGIKQKKRQEKMQNYMFGGWRQEMQRQVEYKQQSEDQDN